MLRSLFCFFTSVVLAQDPIPTANAWRVLTSGHAGCEGAQWIGDTLHYAAHHDLLAFKWSEPTGLVIWRKDSPEATSFRPDGSGGFFVVEQTTRQLTRWNAAGQRIEVLADRFEGKLLNRPNDCMVHPDGSVWFTDPDWLFSKRPQEKKELPGQYVFRFDPRTKTLTRAADGFDKPNGIAFSRDGFRLFVTDTGKSELYRFNVIAGALGPRETIATFPEKGVDGLAVDAKDRLWCCAMKGVHVLSMDGQTLGILEIPGKPTSIAFGPDAWLAVTTRDSCLVTQLK
jgi:gluconolactonase